MRTSSSLRPTRSPLCESQKAELPHNHTGPTSTLRVQKWCPSMTKHNLKVHLDWLLRSRSTLTPPALPTTAATPPLAPPTSPRVHVEEQPPSQLEESVREERNVVERTVQPEFARPPLPARVERVRSEEMARLQSGPKSSKKLQLTGQPVAVGSNSRSSHTSNDSLSKDRGAGFNRYDESKFIRQCSNIFSENSRIKPVAWESETIQTSVGS